MNLSDEAIEAAADLLCEHLSLGPLYARGKAQLILSAAAPLIAAQALRDAANEWSEGAWSEQYIVEGVEDDASSVRATDKWLNTRADELEAPNA